MFSGHGPAAPLVPPCLSASVHGMLYHHCSVCSFALKSSSRMETLPSHALLTPVMYNGCPYVRTGDAAWSPAAVPPAPAPWWALAEPLGHSLGKCRLSRVQAPVCIRVPRFPGTAGMLPPPLCAAGQSPSHCYLPRA